MCGSVNITHSISLEGCIISFRLLKKQVLKNWNAYRSTEDIFNQIFIIKTEIIIINE